jgi:HAD superfamily hydrolase (TIGR01509 family)
MIQALVFDFDGLILDTETPVFRSWQEVYDAHGHRLDFDKWVINIGLGRDVFDPLDHLEQLLGRRVDRLSLDSNRFEREMALVEAQAILPGVEEYLKDARRLGLKIGLASCSSRKWVTGHLKRLGLIEYFDCIRARDDAHSLKPDPELYLAALECLGIKPGQAIAFEDSYYGILAAKRAGIYCVYIPNPLSPRSPLDEADLHLNSLRDLSLEELLRRI